MFLLIYWVGEIVDEIGVPLPYGNMFYGKKQLGYLLLLKHLNIGYLGNNSSLNHGLSNVVNKILKDGINFKC